MIPSVIVVLMGFWLSAEPSGSTRTDSWRITITEESEPGDRLVVSGTVLAADGETPVEGVTVYVYHTDAEGYYNKDENSSRKPRLQGTMRTGKDGRYEFATIKPAAYPGGRNPAHVHYVIRRNGHRELSDELMFAGDPFLSMNAKARSEKEGRFGNIQPVSKGNDGVLRCVKDIRLRE